jgi:NAD(P)H-nitrite reductase large subunit
MDNLICYCKGISKSIIEEAINRGAKTLEEIQDQTRACTGNQCAEKNPSGKCCSGDIYKLLNSYQRRS